MSSKAFQGDSGVSANFPEVPVGLRRVAGSFWSFPKDSRVFSEVSWGCRRASWGFQEVTGVTEVTEVTEVLRPFNTIYEVSGSLMKV